MKTSELTGRQLDYWVAKAEGRPHWVADRDGPTYFSPSTNWAEGGPIIERERILVLSYANEGEYEYDADGNNPKLIAPPRWCASCPDTNEGYDGLGGWVEVCPNDNWRGAGPTPLIAAMRAYVGSKFGDEVPHDAGEDGGAG